MKDMQAHARKIRSDAAECLVLSNLVTEERRQLFGRIAEHLNSLALEIETEAATITFDAPKAGPEERISFDGLPAASPVRQRAARSWWSLLAVLMVIAGASLWAFSILPHQAGSESRPVGLELATLLSKERDERKILGDQLSALLARLDNLAKDLDDLKTLRARVPVQSIKEGLSQDDLSPGMVAKPPPAEETGNHVETGSITNRATTSQTTGSAPATTSRLSETNDQIGTVSSPRTESDTNKPMIGPAGCTRFRSFDPSSGTYTTFDGRRRQCR